MAVGVAVPAPPPLMEGVFWQQEDLGRRMCILIFNIYSWSKRTETAAIAETAAAAAATITKKEKSMVCSTAHLKYDLMFWKSTSLKSCDMRQ